MLRQEYKNKEYKLVRAQLNWRAAGEGFDQGYLELETKINAAAMLGFKLERQIEFERQVQGPGHNDKITAIAVMERDEVPQPAPDWSDSVPGN